MNRNAIFFDRDNTLLACDGYLGDPAKVKLVTGAADAVAKAKALGFATVVVSNQSGVARGMYEEEAVHAVNERFEQMLLAENDKAVIDREEFCPYHPDASIEKYRSDSDLRKPKPGMLLKAARELNLDLSKSWLIGDAPRDIEAGAAAGCRTILFQDPALAKSPAAQAAANVPPTFVASSLEEAMSLIEKETPATVTSSTPSPGTPEEGRGEGSVGSAEHKMQNAELSSVPHSAFCTPHSSENPHPSPLPAYREREQDSQHLEHLTHTCEQILNELRRSHDHTHTEFSVSKLLAGIVQVLVLAALFFAYINRNGGAQTAVLVGLTFQTMTIALLIMGRQR